MGKLCSKLNNITIRLQIIMDRLCSNLYNIIKITNNNGQIMFTIILTESTYKNTVLPLSNM